MDFDFQGQIEFKIQISVVSALSTRVNIKTIFDSLQFFQWRVCLVLHWLTTHLGGGTYLHLMGAVISNWGGALNSSVFAI